MFCPRTKLRGLAVYEDDSLKDDNPGAGTVLRASYNFFILNLRMNYADVGEKISD